MTRDTLTTENRAESAKPSVKTVYFVKIAFPSVTIALTNANRNISFGGVTYLADGRLRSPGKIDERSDLRQEAQELVISGLSPELIACIRDDSYHFSNIAIYMGFLDSSGKLIAGTDPHVFTEDGLLSHASFTVAEKSGEIILTVENRVILLQRAHVVLATHAVQQQRYPNDGGLEMMHMMEDIEIVWGGYPMPESDPERWRRYREFPITEQF